MGAAHVAAGIVPPAAPLTVAELQPLLSTTRYSEEEICQLHAQFTGEVPSGVVPRSTFDVLASAIGVSDPVVASLLFNAFDANGDGVVTFAEFIRGMSAMTRGTIDEKLHFSFRMYDSRRAGFLSRDDVGVVARALTSSFPPYSGEADPERLAAAMFERSDGRLSFAAYKEFALSSPAVVKGLGLGAATPR